MQKFRMMGAMLAAGALSTLAVPADARGWGHHRHRGDGIDGGDVLLGAVLAGGLIAAISAATRADRDRRTVPYDQVNPPPPPADWQHGSTAAEDWRSEDAPGREDDGADWGAADAEPATYSENAAVDSCAVAVEEEGRKLAPIARVQDVTDVDARGDGSWFVQGTIELRDGYRDAERREQKFRCTISTGSYPEIAIEGDRFAAR